VEDEIVFYIITVRIMKTNEGTTDRLIRLFIGVFAIIGAYFWLAGSIQIVVYILGAIAILTGCI
jgi:hypothetical protein